MKLRVATVGTGWVAEDRHLPSFLSDSRVQVVAVVDRRQERAQAVAQRLRIPRVFSDVEEAFDAGIDVLDICTPPTSHPELISAALRRQVHVFTEKPLTVGAEASRALVAQHRELAGQVKASVSHNFLWSRSARAAQERIISGEAGEVLSVRGIQLSSEGRRLPTWYHALPGGLFYDEAPHLFYMVRAFAGELSNVSARAWDVDMDRPQPIGHLEALFDGTRAPAHITMNFRSPVSEWLIVITCSRRVMVIDMFRDIFLELRSDGNHRSSDVLRSSGSLGVQAVLQFAKSGLLFARGRLKYGHDRMIHEFVDAIVRNGPEPMPLAEGERVITLMDDLLDSAGLGEVDWVARQQRVAELATP